MVAALRNTPFDTGIDLKQLEEPARITKEIKEKYDKYETGYTGVSADVLTHKFPGGMISNMVAQLKEADRMDLMEAALKESPSVERDLGYPPLLTPTSQIVGVQAVLNVLRESATRSSPARSATTSPASTGAHPVPSAKTWSRKS